MSYIYALDDKHSTMSKQYGLINPKAKKSVTAAVSAAKFFQKRNVFDDGDEDSSSGADEDKVGGTGQAKAVGPTDYVKSSMQASIKKQTKMAQQKAMEEDATVFQYDEVYDDMQAKKAKEAAALKKEGQDKKPRYIQNLLKQAEVRNRENERRIERKVQKEREAEGDQFKDKDVFVTSAYRKKMEEMQKQEEEEQRREQMEAMLDVTKQKDMGGFYRHLYRQTMGEEKGQKEESNVEKEQNIKKVTNPAKERSYRKRSEGEGQGVESSDEESRSDSSSLSDSDSDAEGEHSKTREEKLAERKARMREDKEKREKRKRKIELGEESSEDEQDEGKKRAIVEGKSREQAEEEEKEAKMQREEARKAKREEKLRRRREVWNKRTVGDIFQSAIQRYFERKAQRTQFPWKV